MADRTTQARPGRLALDLFCGAGGLSEGLRQAGFHTVAANDFDPWAGATFRANHEPHGTVFVPGDIGSPAVQGQLLELAQGREIDLIAGGPPCQAFSQVRNHDRLIDDLEHRAATGERCAQLARVRAEGDRVTAAAIQDAGNAAAATQAARGARALGRAR